VVHRVFMEAVVARSNAAHADSTTKSADMANSTKADDVSAGANAPNMAAAKASHMAAAESAAAARLGRGRQQTRSQ
jgi:hypothetical protein